MQAHDQDELRKQAQRALSRRIGTDSSESSAPPQQDERPRERERPRPRRRAEEQPRSREPREREFTASEAAEPRVIETVSRQDAEEPMARTERRPVASSENAPQVERSAYDVRAPRHGEIYNQLHSRASLRRALIINEVLGRPKALRESTDPENFSGI